MMALIKSSRTFYEFMMAKFGFASSLGYINVRTTTSGIVNSPNKAIESGFIAGSEYRRQKLKKTIDHSSLDL